MPTEIQTPKPWMRLAEAFRLTGRHKLLLDEVVVPVAIVEDLSEKEVLLDLRAAYGGAFQTAAATFISQVQLFNPVDSGLLLDLYRVDMLNPTGALQFLMGDFAIALTVAQDGRWQDARMDGIPKGQIRRDLQPVSPILVDPLIVQGLQNVQVVYPLRVTLPPGHGWMVETSFVDKSLMANFLWTERAE